MIDDIEVTEYSYVRGLFGVANFMATKDKAIPRTEKGQFIGSGNPKGRPRNSKNQASKQKLDNLADKYGSLAFKKIFEMGQAAQDKGDLQLAYRCYSFCAGQYVTVTMHNDRMQIQQSSKRPEELSDEQDDDLQNGAVIQVNFKKADVG